MVDALEHRLNRLSAVDLYRVMYATTNCKPGDMNRSPAPGRPDLRSIDDKRKYVTQVVHTDEDLTAVSTIIDWVDATPGKRHADYVGRHADGTKYNLYPEIAKSYPFTWNGSTSVPSVPTTEKVEPVKLPENAHVPAAANSLASALADLMSSSIDEAKVRAIVADAVKDVEPRTITVVLNHKGEPQTVPGHVRPEFQTILARANRGQHQLLIGPAGSGKTHVCGQVADALGLELFIISGAGDITPSTLFGRWMPTGAQGQMIFHEGVVIQWARAGGLLLIDEMDAMDPTCLLSLNLALAQKKLSVAQTGELIPLHEDCRVIATANTFGQGATMQYAGREALDGATIDRFAAGRLVVGYDEGFEKASCNADLLRWAMPVRKRILDLGLRRILSTRFLLDGTMAMADGETLAMVREAFFIGWSDDEKMKVGA